MFLEPTDGIKTYTLYWIQKANNHGYLHKTECYGANLKEAKLNLRNYTHGSLRCHPFTISTTAPITTDQGVSYNGMTYTRAWRNMLW